MSFTRPALADTDDLDAYVFAQGERVCTLALDDIASINLELRRFNSHDRVGPYLENERPVVEGDRIAVGIYISAHSKHARDLNQAVTLGEALALCDNPAAYHGPHAD